MSGAIFRFSERSYRNLLGVRPELVAVATLGLSLSHVDFGITQGLRTPEQQARLVRAGASQTHHSPHLTGHAIDVAAWVDGEVRWDWPLYERIHDAMSLAAERLGVDLVWGGHWLTLRDGPHFELSRARYPA